MKPATAEELSIAQARLLDHIHAGDLSETGMALAVLRGHVINLELARRGAGGKSVDAEATIRPLRRILAVDIIQDITRIGPRVPPKPPPRATLPATVTRNRNPDLLVLVIAMLIALVSMVVLVINLTQT